MQAKDISICPSFNCYSTTAQLSGEVAARVRGEEPADRSRDSDCEATEDDFEFVSLSANPDIDLDQFFTDGGEIRRIFPVFNRDLVIDHLKNAAEDETEVSVCIPLHKLFLEEDRDPPWSSSSSEADELESVAPGTYCVWTPKLADPSPGRCVKSSSTGSSATAKQPRRWSFRDLLKRSNSEGGKNSNLVFLTPAPPSKSSKSEKKADKGSKSTEKKGTPSSAAAGERKAVSAHEKHYVMNRKMKEEEKRRSYLPYRPDLVGFFATVNGFGRTFPPF